MTTPTSSRSSSEKVSSDKAYTIGGYDEDRFVSPVADHFKCSICLDVLRDPVQCQQEHATCRSCIQKYIVDVGQQCPTCLEPLSMQTLLPWPRILRNLQSELRIYCRFNADGCAAEVYLGDLANHERACKFNKADEVRRNSPSPDSESNLDSIASFTLFKGAYASLEPNDKIRALENYVSQHESGNRISWNITARSSLNARPSVDFGQVDRLALLSITKADVSTGDIIIDRASSSGGIVIDQEARTITGCNPDHGGCAVAEVRLTSGKHYWQVFIERLWDHVCGSLRVGLVLDDEMNIETQGLGDCPHSVGWWDNTVDGAVYRHFAECGGIREKDSIGLLLDVDGHTLELYQNSRYVGSVEVPRRKTYRPAFFTRTKFDCIRLILDPDIPSGQLHNTARLNALEEYVRRHESGDFVSWSEVRQRAVSDEAFYSSAQTAHASEDGSSRIVRHTLQFDEESSSPNLEFRNNHATMTSRYEDAGGCALAKVSLSHGMHYWEVVVDSLWDDEGSDGSLRVGLCLGDRLDADSGLGDNPHTIGWWDETVDGAVYTDLSGCPHTTEKCTLGLLLDADNHFLWLYYDQKEICRIVIPSSCVYRPAFYTRTHFDRMSLVQNPSLPRCVRQEEASAETLEF